jgi:enoyl-CoA hydratase
MAEFVRVDVAGGVGVITLDRAPFNALNFALRDELRAAARAVAADEGVRAVVVWGGGKVFATGLDVAELAGGATSAAEVQSLVAALAGVPKPVVAAISGYALGAGFELALACDRRIIGDNVKLGLPQALLGLVPGGGGMRRLAALVGPAKAKDIVFTGRFVEHEEALELGLADQVVAPDEVFATARAWAAQFAGASPTALAAAKGAVDEGIGLDEAAGLALERRSFDAAFAGADSAVGLQSFLSEGLGQATFAGK